MENYIVEVVPPFQPPSSDASLVLFADENVYTGHAEVLKYLMRCSQYALKNKTYLVSGMIEHDDNLCLSLFNPRGKAICRQAALHLSLAQANHLEPEDEVQVIPTELGNLYLCVDEDIYHPQTMRTAALKGADTILSLQQLDPAFDTPEQLLETAWNASQSNNVYVVNITSRGAAVTCPVPVTRARDGYLVKRTGIYPVRFGLNMKRLDEIREGLQLMESINPALAVQYADELGGGW